MCKDSLTILSSATATMSVQYLFNVLVLVTTCGQTLIPLLHLLKQQPLPVFHLFHSQCLNWILHCLVQAASCRHPSGCVNVCLCRSAIALVRRDLGHRGSCRAGFWPGDTMRGVRSLTLCAKHFFPSQQLQSCVITVKCWMGQLSPEFYLNSLWHHMEMSLWVNLTQLNDCV